MFVGCGCTVQSAATMAPQLNPTLRPNGLSATCLKGVWSCEYASRTGRLPMDSEAMDAACIPKASGPQPQ